jgi:hypothetical protein
MGKPLPFCFILLCIVTFRDKTPTLSEDLLYKAVSALHQPHTTNGGAVI